MLVFLKTPFSYLVQWYYEGKSLLKSAVLVHWTAKSTRSKNAQKKCFVSINVEIIRLRNTQSLGM